MTDRLITGPFVAPGLHVVLDAAGLDLGPGEDLLLPVFEKLILVSAQAADDETRGRCCSVCHRKATRGVRRGSNVVRRT